MLLVPSKSLHSLLLLLLPLLLWLGSNRAPPYHCVLVGTCIRLDVGIVAVLRLLSLYRYYYYECDYCRGGRGSIVEIILVYRV